MIISENGGGEGEGEGWEGSHNHIISPNFGDEKVQMCLQKHLHFSGS